MLIEPRVESAAYATCLNNPPDYNNIQQLDNELYQVHVVGTHFIGYCLPDRLIPLVMLAGIQIAEILGFKSKMAPVLCKKCLG